MEKTIEINKEGINIFIDDKQYNLTQSVIRGSELRSLAGLNTDANIWHSVPGPGNDKFIEPFDTINVEEGMIFFSGKKMIFSNK